jgi:hypothetical protein
MKKKPIPIINSFKSIQFDDTKKPLIICDIDHTFLRCLHDFNHFYILISGGKTYNPNCKFLHQDAVDLMNLAYNQGFVRQTDPDGFAAMVKRVEMLGGKFVFLTARGIGHHQKTLGDLRKAGLEAPENYEIHYTNNDISKGEYLKRLGIISKFQHASFIDDNPLFLASVYRIFPQVNCYLFKYI